MTSGIKINWIKKKKNPILVSYLCKCSHDPSCKLLFHAKHEQGAINWAYIFYTNSSNGYFKLKNQIFIMFYNYYK